MSKNILYKFRKSLEQSSKIVYDSTSNSHRISPRRSQLQTINQYAEKMQNETFLPSLQQSQRLLKRIPILLSENDQLREKVSRLQQEIRQKNYQKISKEKKLHRVVKTQMNGESQYKLANYQSDGSTGSSLISGRLYQSLRIGSRWDSLDPKARAQSTYFSHSMQKRADLASLQTEIVKFLQKKIDELKLQNNELLIKYNTALKARKTTCQEIDKIKQNFEITLNKQIEVFKKKEDFYDQKIKNLQIITFKAEEQSRLLKMHNETLQSKVLELQSGINKYRVTSKDLIVSYKNKCVWEKQNNILSQDINHLWCIKQQQYNNINNLLGNLRIFKGR